jgi:glycosyltransferase involved in cell wall biosynthesis
MRVLHVIPSISHAHGGPSAAIRAIASASAAAGTDVEIATTDDDGHAGRFPVVADGRRVDYDGMSVRFFPRQSLAYKVSLPLAAWLSANARVYDVVHIHALFSFACSAAGWIAMRQSIPYVVRPLGVLSPYGLERRRPALKAVSLRLNEARIVAGADAMHYTSVQERAEAAAVDHCRYAAVIPLGIDLPERGSRERFLAERPGLAGKRLVVFLSRVDPKKNLASLIAALADIAQRDPRAHLVVAGNGAPSHLASLMSLARGLGVSHRISWLGHVAGDDKADLLAAADVYVLPSFAENFGIAVVEALGAGVPCVVSREVGIAREIEAAGAGRLVGTDPATIAEGVSALLSDRAALVRMRLAAMRLVEARFTTRAMGASLAALYERIVEERWRAGENERTAGRREIPPRPPRPLRRPL